MTDDDKFDAVTRGAFSHAEQHIGPEMYQAQVAYQEVMTKGIESNIEIAKVKLALRTNKQAVVGRVVSLLLIYSVPVYFITLVWYIKVMLGG